MCLDEEGSGGGSDDDANNDENEEDFAEFAEDAPNENDGDESDSPDNKGVDSEVIANRFYGVGGAVDDLLARFGDLININVGNIIDNIFHVILA